MSQANVISTAEDVADSFLRSTRQYLRPVARFLLLCTFIEDGIRMITQWEEQQNFFEFTWKCGGFLSFLIVLINCVFQLAPSGAILFQRQVRPAVGALMGIVLFQSIMYKSLWTWGFFLRNLSIIGSLFLLLSEAFDDSPRGLSSMLPTLPQNKAGDYLQLVGRVMIVCMFLSLIKFDSMLRIVLEAIGVALLALLAVGFKTKLSALSLVAVLTLQNVLLNAFWTLSSSSPLYDFRKYDFFQTVTVIGGLLMVVALGPGGVSIDSKKKYS